MQRLNGRSLKDLNELGEEIWIACLEERFWLALWYDPRIQKTFFIWGIVHAEITQNACNEKTWEIWLFWMNADFILETVLGNVQFLVLRNVHCKHEFMPTSFTWSIKRNTNVWSVHFFWRIFVIEVFGMVLIRVHFWNEVRMNEILSYGHTGYKETCLKLNPVIFSFASLGRCIFHI